MTKEQIILYIAIGAAIVILLVVGCFLLKHRAKKQDKNHKLEQKALEHEQEVTPLEESKPLEPVLQSTVEEEDEDVKEDFEQEEEPEKTVQVINGRKIFVQYSYSFMAKLILASNEVQQQYRDLIAYVQSYGVKTSISWKQERIYLGRNTYALLLFRGKKLCIAYALNPKEYEESKYHFIDVSEVKRFIKTQALFKLTSERKQKYALELFDQIFSKEGYERNEQNEFDLTIPIKTKDELIEEKLIKVYTSDEPTEDATLVTANVSDIIRKNVTITEAKALITDDAALEYVEVEESNKSLHTYQKKDIINIDTLSKNFQADELVNLESLKEKKLISSKVDYLKVLARGVLDKPLIVEATDFSIDAIKMIILTGGQVRKVK